MNEVTEETADFAIRVTEAAIKLAQSTAYPLEEVTASLLQATMLYSRFNLLNAAVRAWADTYRDAGYTADFDANPKATEELLATLEVVNNS
jgi:hypothetical protein